MLFTPLWFWALRREIETFAVGAAVVGGRLSLPALRLSLERNDEIRDLVCWLDPAYARAEWSEPRDVGDLTGKWTALQTAVCQSVEQPQSDRRLRLTFRTNDAELLRLDFFAFGKSGLSLARLDPEPAEIASVGQIPRSLGAPQKPLVIDLDSDTTPPDQPCTDLSRWLHGAVRGLDSLWIESARKAAGIPTDTQDIPAEQAHSAWSFICRHAETLRNQPQRSYVVERAKAPLQVSLIDFGTHLPELTFIPAESLSAASGRVVYALRRQDTRAEESSKLLALARSKRSRLRRRLARLEADAGEQQDHEIWQENADWLTARLGQIRQGETTLEIPSADGTRTVSLDPAIPPSRLAERWYHKARRLRRGLEITRKQLDATKAELARLEAALAAATAHDSADTAARADAMQQLRDLVADTASATRRSKAEPRLPFRRFRSPGGLAIWVGRNNKENDELTLHQAHKKDLWFHAQQTAGSHVVLRSHALNQAPARVDILAAAAVAAFYSKARHSAKVPVIYTEARYVRKPRKAPPGQVLVEREKSVMVAPQKPPEWHEAD